MHDVAVKSSATPQHVNGALWYPFAAPSALTPHEPAPVAAAVVTGLEPLGQVKSLQVVEASEQHRDVHMYIPA